MFNRVGVIREEHQKETPRRNETTTNKNIRNRELIRNTEKERKLRTKAEELQKIRIVAREDNLQRKVMQP